MDLEPALDKVDYGWGGNAKTISFDVPHQHAFGIQKYRSKFWEKLYRGEDVKQARQLEKVIEQLKDAVFTQGRESRLGNFVRGGGTPGG